MVQSYYWGKLGGGYTGPFCTIVATSHESISFSKHYQKETTEMPWLLPLQQEFYVNEFENIDEMGKFLEKLPILKALNKFYETYKNTLDPKEKKCNISQLNVNDNGVNFASPIELYVQLNWFYLLQYLVIS